MTLKKKKSAMEEANLLKFLLPRRKENRNKSQSNKTKRVSTSMVFSNQMKMIENSSTCKSWIRQFWRQMLQEIAMFSKKCSHREGQSWRDWHLLWGMNSFLRRHLSWSFRFKNCCRKTNGISFCSRIKLRLSLGIFSVLQFILVHRLELIMIMKRWLNLLS